MELLVPEYFVMQCKPSKTIEVRERLVAVFGDDAVVAPSYRAIMRLGRARVRTETERPVLGGIIFASAEAKRSCGCRERQGDPLRAVPMLGLEKDENGDRRHATVEGVELQPIIDYAAERNAAFMGAKLRKNAPLASVPVVPVPVPVPVAVAVVVGDRVQLTGALSGMVGTVEAVDARGEATVKLDMSGGLFGDSITVPVVMLQKVEGVEA